MTQRVSRVTKLLSGCIVIAFGTAMRLVQALPMDLFPALRMQEEGRPIPKTVLPVNSKVNDKWYNIRRFMGEKTQENLTMGYSAAYPTGRERCLDQKGCEI